MGHERGDLDEDWGYHSRSECVSISTEIDSGLQLDLQTVARDTGAMHSLSLEVFREYQNSDVSISSRESFEHALNAVMYRIGCDAFDNDEITELWSGSLNFSEFTLLLRELLVSMHRAMTVEIVAEDVLINELEGSHI